MTRRTPQAGDSYVRGEWTVTVKFVKSCRVWWTARLAGGDEGDVNDMPLSRFHDDVARATWGRA